MKKYLAVFTAISLVSTVSAFEDKPALSRAERAALIAAKGAGVGMGAALGAESGARAGSIALRPKGDEPHLKWVRDQWSEEGRKKGAMIGIAAGGYVGYKGSSALAIRALAKRHGVSNRVEEISQYYNINILQYKPILITATQKDPKRLLEMINQVYTFRFGENWKELLQKLFKQYQNKAENFVGQSSFSREGNLKNFLRMVELGAAMANLYFGTNPNIKNSFDSAESLYQELGLLK